MLPTWATVRGLSCTPRWYCKGDKEGRWPGVWSPTCLPASLGVHGSSDQMVRVPPCRPASCGFRSEIVTRRDHDDIMTLRSPKEESRAQTSTALPTLRPPASAASWQTSRCRMKAPGKKQAMEVSPRHWESLGQERQQKTQGICILQRQTDLGLNPWLCQFGESFILSHPWVPHL